MQIRSDGTSCVPQKFEINNKKGKIMFSYIRGKLIQATPVFAVVETGGIGYKIFIPVNVLNRLSQVGSDVMLHLSFVVREQAQSLYGFLTVSERDFFEALIGVTGIGPKIGLALIGHMPLAELQQAIASEEAAVLCRIPGIGKKGAERLIVEMRDKVGGYGIHPSDLAVHLVVDPKTQRITDAMSALINLGYNQVTAQKAIQKAMKETPGTDDLSMLISSALKHV
jgi:Holliday junction DNA helicase RuvA